MTSSELDEFLLDARENLVRVLCENVLAAQSLRQKLYYRRRFFTPSACTISIEKCEVILRPKKSIIGAKKEKS